LKNPLHVAIAGGGIAGTFLAAALCRLNFRVTLFDVKLPGASSPVAAGLFNVITGRNAVKSKMAEEFISNLRGFFSYPGFAAAGKHIHWNPIYRPFHSAGEQNDWLHRAGKGVTGNFAEFLEEPIMPSQIRNPLGGIMIRGAGWCNVPLLLSELRHCLIYSFGLVSIPMRVDEFVLLPEKSAIRMGASVLQYDHLVFAEGAAVASNPYFPSLPLRPLKGQIAVVHIPGFAPPFAISHGIYIIPIGNFRFLAGATNELEFSNPDPDEKGAEEISKGIRSDLLLPFSIESMAAGIRPTTPDRNPFLGTSPGYSNIHIFNGMGTKSILQGPHFAELFARYLSGSDEIPPDCDISRF